MRVIAVSFHGDSRSRSAGGDELAVRLGDGPVQPQRLRFALRAPKRQVERGQDEQVDAASR